jgi:hypothetical protein
MEAKYMSIIKKHKKRVEKIKSYTAKNKLFIAMAATALVFLLVTVIFNSESPQGESGYEVSGLPQPDPDIGSGASPPPPDEGWRFYFIDLWVLGIGGGFCLVMIIRQRKKAKEELK